jgi:hypothetical protein
LLKGAVHAPMEGLYQVIKLLWCFLFSCEHTTQMTLQSGEWEFFFSFWCVFVMLIIILYYSFSSHLDILNYWTKITVFSPGHMFCHLFRNNFLSFE